MAKAKEKIPQEPKPPKAPKAPKAPGKYKQIIEKIFLNNCKDGAEKVDFIRDELSDVAAALGFKTPKNLGDIPYSFRYRNDLPDAIRQTAPAEYGWIIRSVGTAKYQFALALKTLINIKPNMALASSKIPNCTPGIVERYATSDEQGLLANLRYNRLIDIFTGLTCYSLQNHLRTTVPDIGQIETDELYIGVDKRGVHYIIPVQAKGGKDLLGIVQIEQDMAMCKDKFPTLICRPIAAQFMKAGGIAIFEFEQEADGIKIAAERHYYLVQPAELTTEELESYKTRTLS